MNELRELKPNEIIYTKGYYYSYVELVNGKHYIFISDMDKKSSVKQVYKFLGVSSKKEYSQIDKHKSIEPNFYKHTGDMSLIEIDSFCKEGLRNGAEVVYIPFDYDSLQFMHVEKS